MPSKRPTYKGGRTNVTEIRNHTPFDWVNEDLVVLAIFLPSVCLLVILCLGFLMRLWDASQRRAQMKRVKRGSDMKVVQEESIRWIDAHSDTDILQSVAEDIRRGIGDSGDGELYDGDGTPRVYLMRSLAEKMIDRLGDIAKRLAILDWGKPCRTNDQPTKAAEPTAQDTASEETPTSEDTAADGNGTEKGT